MREHVNADEQFVREDVTVAEALERFRAEGQDYKVELIEDLVANADRRRDRQPLHERPVHRPLPRPARAGHQAHQGVQAAVRRRRVLARRLRPHAAHAHLRHRVLLQGGPQGPPRAPRAGQRPRPPQLGPRARPVHVLRGRARQRVLAARRHDDVQRARRAQPRDGHRARLHRGQDAAALRLGAVEDLRPLGQVPREHVRHRDRGPRVRRQADELPRPRAPLQHAAVVLPRPAGPLLRAGPAAPQRAERHAARPAARAPLRPGRRPHLLHGGAGPGRGRRPAWTSPSTPTGCSASSRTSSCRRARSSGSATTRCGIAPRPRSSARWRSAACRTCSTRATARSTGRRSTCT